MKKILILLVISTIIVSKLAAAVATTGDMAPNIPSPIWMDGKVYRIAEYKGKKFVVVFLWAPDQRALAEFQQMNRIARMPANADTAFLSVANCDLETLKKFPGAAKLTFPVCADHNRATAKLYMRSFDRLPLAVVIGKEGRIYWRGSIRQVPAVLKLIRENKFDLPERIRTEKFTLDVSDAIKNKQFDKANKLIYAEWERFPANLELLSMYLLISGRHLKRFDDGFKVIAEAGKKLPGNPEVGVLEFQHICSAGLFNRLDEFSKRMIAVHGSNPDTMTKFASLFIKLPAKELQPRQINAFLSAGWRNGKFKNDAEKANYAINYAKLMHSFGRTDIACKLAIFAEQKLNGKAKASAAEAVTYYKKIIAESSKLAL